MALTRAEALAAAERADGYPVGRGRSYFSHLEIENARYAAEVIQDNPGALEYG
jgi:hypothetical protein